MAAALYYFHGRGRAEQSRWMLAAAGISFENRCLSTAAQFEHLKAQGMLLFGQVPMLEIDGLRLVQSQAIVRYIARRANMYGASPQDMAQCDMICDTINDFQGGIMGYPFSQDRDGHLRVIAGAVRRYCPQFEAILQRNNAANGVDDERRVRGRRCGPGGVHLVGSALTFADVLLAQILTAHVELLPEVLKPYPALAALREYVVTLPQVAAYLSSPLYFPTPTGAVGDAYVQNVQDVLY